MAGRRRNDRTASYWMSGGVPVGTPGSSYRAACSLPSVSVRWYGWAWTMHRLWRYYASITSTVLLSWMGSESLSEKLWST